MRKALCLLFILICFFKASAQQKQIDSLKLSLTKATEDTTRVKLLAELSRNYYLQKPDSGLRYAVKAFTLAKEASYERGEMRSLTQMGYSMWLLGNAPGALQNFIQSQHIAENLNDKWSIARNYDGMSCVYDEQGDHKLAVTYSKKSEMLFREVGDYGNVVNELAGIGYIYKSMGKLDSALTYDNRALELSIKINEWVWRPQILVNLGAVHIELNNKIIALAYMHKAIALCIEYNETYNLALSYFTIATSFKNLNQRDSCIYYAKKTLDVAQQGSLALYALKASSLLAQLYYGNDDHEAARYYKISGSIKDSLFNAEKTKQVLILNFTEKRHQQELADQKQKEHEERKENLQLSAIALFIVFFLFVALMLSRTRTHQRVIEFMGVLSLLLVFEFITLFIHPYIQKLTHHTPVFEYLILVIMAAVLVPSHHKLTHWLKEKLVQVHNQIVTKKVGDKSHGNK